jgi:ribonuclease P protein component
MKEYQENTSSVSFGFKKEERLCSKKTIEKLFAEGVSFLSYPIKIIFLETEITSSFPIQSGFAASKKNFKRAVKRNRIKRLMRESYRLKKHILYDSLDEKQFAIFFVYIGKELPKQDKIDKAMSKAISLLIKKTKASEES